jgi:hypothetical protein
MNVSDEIRKTLSDPKPFYALAGVGDLAAEKLKDAPERLREAPTLLAEAGATLTTLANKLAAEGPERLSKVTSSVQDVAGKGRPDAEALRGIAQTVAIQQVGRLLEAAGKAVETYDELAERGRIVVSRYTGVGAEPADGEGASEGAVTVLVEQVTDEDDGFAPGYGFAKAEPEEEAEEEAEPAEPAEPVAESAAEAAEAFERPDTAAEAAQVFEEAEVTEAAEEPAPKKKPAPRKRAAAPKSPRTPKD